MTGFEVTVTGDLPRRLRTMACVADPVPLPARDVMSLAGLVDAVDALVLSSRDIKARADAARAAALRWQLVAMGLALACGVLLAEVLA